jgi:hypothetical protein
MSAMATTCCARGTSGGLAVAPARRFARQVADDQAGRVDAARLEILGIRADVADVRVGERDDLAGVPRDP